MNALVSLSVLLERLRTDRAVLVMVQATQGSVPREAGAWMVVFAHDALGTIGGGKLELDATAHARALLGGASLALQVSYPLGPSLGQCCGGVVQLGYTPVCAHDIGALQARLQSQRVPVAVFGAGHVGQALVRVLATLPMQVLWVDSRDQVFPTDLPDAVQCEHSEPLHAAVAHLAAHSRVLVMSFSHAEDLDIVAACLRRQRQRSDLPYIGMIGSATKWATFRKKLLARGFAEGELQQVICPIGVPGIADKRPEVIAVAVAAQLLQLASNH